MGKYGLTSIQSSAPIPFALPTGTTNGHP